MIFLAGVSQLGFFWFDMLRDLLERSYNCLWGKISIMSNISMKMPKFSLWKIMSVTFSSVTGAVRLCLWFFLRSVGFIGLLNASVYFVLIFFLLDSKKILVDHDVVVVWCHCYIELTCYCPLHWKWHLVFISLTIPTFFVD